MLTRQQEKNEAMKSELNKTLKDRSDNGQGLVMNPQLAKSQFKKLLAGEDIARKLGKLNSDEKLSNSELKKIHTTNADKNASKAFGKYCKENLAGNRGSEHLASHLAQKLDHSDPEDQTLDISQATVTKGPSTANKAAQATANGLKNGGAAVVVGVAGAGAGVAGAGIAAATLTKKVVGAGVGTVIGAGAGAFIGARRGAISGWRREQKHEAAQSEQGSEVDDVANLSDVDSLFVEDHNEEGVLLDTAKQLTKKEGNKAESVTYSQSMLGADNVSEAPNKKQIPSIDAPKRKRDAFKRKASAFIAMFKKTPKNKAEQQNSSGEPGNTMKRRLFDSLRNSNKNKTANKDPATATATAPMAAPVNPAITKLKDQLRIAEIRLSIATTGGDSSDLNNAGLLNKDIDVSGQLYAELAVNPVPQGAHKSEHLFNIEQGILKNHPDYIKMDAIDYTVADVKALKNEISKLKAEISDLENPQAEAAKASVQEPGEQNNAQNIANINGAEAIPTAPPLPTRKPNPPLPGQTESFDPRQAAKAAKAATSAS
jgi:hypothetical protein